MKRISVGLILISLAILHDVALGGGWGPTFDIEVHSHEFEKPLTITEPSIVEGLSFWVGPGTGYSEFMGPVAYSKSTVDWDKGEVLKKQEVLPRYEVRFLLGSRDDPATYMVLYEPDPFNKSGYVYYPTVRPMHDGVTVDIPRMRTHRTSRDAVPFDGRDFARVATRG